MKLANSQNGIITKQDVIELLKVTPSQAYAVIKKLQAEGRLELLCGGKYSKYKVINAMLPDNLPKDIQKFYNKAHK